MPRLFYEGGTEMLQQSEKVYANKFAEITGYPLAAVKQLCKTGIISYLPVGNKYLIDTEQALVEINTYQETLKQQKQQRPLNVVEVSETLIIRTNDFASSLKSLLKKNA